MEQFNLIIDSFVYLAYYAAILLFTIKHRKDIYTAACGGNGIPQPNELVKLFSVYILTIYSNEVAHQHVAFDIQFGVFLLGCIGIANLGRFNLDKIKSVFNSDDKKEKESH